MTKTIEVVEVPDGLEARSTLECVFTELGLEYEVIENLDFGEGVEVPSVRIVVERPTRIVMFDIY